MIFRTAALVATLVLVIIPFAAGAQPGERMPRIGILSPAPAAAVAGPPFDAFREALRELGYVEGRNIALEFRFSDGNRELLPKLAVDLVRLPVDVIVTDGGDLTARAALSASTRIQIVMETASDPVASGLVASLARPGGNISGFTLPYVEIAGKRLQLLKEIVPAVTRVAVLWERDQGALQFRAVETAARSLGLQIESLPVRGSNDLDTAFETAIRHRAGAILQLSSRMLHDNRKAISQRALKHRLPGMFELGFVDTGALACYGVSVSDNFRRAAVYVDKILKGARAGDLPVEAPSKYQLVINSRTVRALGLTIPPSVLLQATKILE
jgi:putative ABC transport system substrate-binding protein